MVRKDFNFKNILLGIIIIKLDKNIIILAENKLIFHKYFSCYYYVIIHE